MVAAPAAGWEGRLGRIVCDRHRGRNDELSGFTEDIAKDGCRRPVAGSGKAEPSLEEIHFVRPSPIPKIIPRSYARSRSAQFPGRSPPFGHPPSPALSGSAPMCCSPCRRAWEHLPASHWDREAVRPDARCRSPWRSTPEDPSPQSGPASYPGRGGEQTELAERHVPMWSPSIGWNPSRSVYTPGLIFCLR